MHNTPFRSGYLMPTLSQGEYKISFFWCRDLEKSLHSVAVFIWRSLCVFSFPRWPIQHFISPQCQNHIVLDPVTALPWANTLISLSVHLVPILPFPSSDYPPWFLLYFYFPTHFFLPFWGAGSGLFPSAKASCFLRSNSLFTSAVITAFSAFWAFSARTFSPYDR